MLFRSAPVTIPFKTPGRDVVLLGGLGECDAVRFGSSQYAAVVAGNTWGLPPALDLEYEKRVHTAIREIVNAGLAESSHDLGEGGLAVALAESCSGGIGAKVNLDTQLAPEVALFHEGPSRILISTAKRAEVEAIAAKHAVRCTHIGATMEPHLQIGPWLNAPVGRLLDVWQSALQRQLEPKHV